MTFLNYFRGIRFTAGDRLGLTFQTHKEAPVQKLEFVTNETYSPESIEKEFDGDVKPFNNKSILTSQYLEDKNGDILLNHHIQRNTAVKWRKVYVNWDITHHFLSLANSIKILEPSEVFIDTLLSLEDIHFSTIVPNQRLVFSGKNQILFDYTTEESVHDWGFGSTFNAQEIDYSIYEDHDMMFKLLGKRCNGK